MVNVLHPVMVSNIGAEHGEGPLWHPKDKRLDWTDLKAGRLHRFDPVTEQDEVIEIGSSLGSFAARENGGYVLAVGSGFAFLDITTNRCELVVPIDYGPGPQVRMNDGKVDPQGRFWAGTMAQNVAARRGVLYRLDSDLTVTKVLEGVTISNGMDWTRDCRIFYYIDSLDGLAPLQPKETGIDAFDFDAETGTISNRRRIIKIANVTSGPTWMTIPDGMTLDAEDFIWVAIPGSGEVRRYSPRGDLDSIIKMPVYCPTSIAFGGEDLQELYITTMTLEIAVPPGYRIHEAFKTRRENEGALFKCRPKVPGRPSRMFAG